MFRKKIPDAENSQRKKEKNHYKQKLKEWRKKTAAEIKFTHAMLRNLCATAKFTHVKSGIGQARNIAKDYGKIIILQNKLTHDLVIGLLVEFRKIDFRKTRLCEIMKINKWIIN